MRQALAATALIAIACGRAPEKQSASGSSTQAETTRVAATQGATTATTATTVAKSPPTAQKTTGTASSRAPDTLVGRIVVVGMDPTTYTALALSNGTQVRLNGMDAQAIGSITGAQAWVSGKRVASGLDLEEFEIRRVNDQLVDDGIVVVRPNAVSIRTRSGRVRDIPDAPHELHSLNGARIWITRPVTGVAPSFGVIFRSRG
jgi:hypothetical protein